MLDNKDSSQISLHTLLSLVGCWLIIGRPIKTSSCLLPKGLLTWLEDLDICPSLSCCTCSLCLSYCNPRLQISLRHRNSLPVSSYRIDAGDRSTRMCTYTIKTQCAEQRIWSIHIDYPNTQFGSQLGLVSSYYQPKLLLFCPMYSSPQGLGKCSCSAWSLPFLWHHNSWSFKLSVDENHTWACPARSALAASAVWVQ